MLVGKQPILKFSGFKIFSGIDCASLVILEEKN